MENETNITNYFRNILEIGNYSTSMMGGIRSELNSLYYHIALQMNSHRVSTNIYNIVCIDAPLDTFNEIENNARDESSFNTINNTSNEHETYFIADLKPFIRRKRQLKVTTNVREEMKENYKKLCDERRKKEREEWKKRVHESKSFIKKMQSVQRGIQKKQDEQLKKLIRRLSLEKKVLDPNIIDRITKNRLKKREVSFESLKREQCTIYNALNKFPSASKEIDKQINNRMNIKEENINNTFNDKEVNELINNYLSNRKLQVPHNRGIHIYSKNINT